MKQRIITGIILIAFFVPLVVLGGIPFYCLIAVAIGWAMYELMHATEGKILKTEEPKRCLNWPIFMIVLATFLTVVGVFYPHLNNIIDGNGFISSTLTLPIIPFVLLSFVLFGGTVLSERVNIQDVFMVLAMSIFLMIGGQSATLIRDLGGQFITFVLLTCILTDTGAYFVGMLCSKKFKTHKLNERISPKKTIEGSIGGIIFGTLIPFLITLIPAMKLKSTSLLSFELEWWIVLSLAFVMSIIAQLGDLTFSAIKRHYDIKDYSQIFPGHGGVLDRLDSILFNMIFFAVIIVFIATGTIF